jgi:exoribonuclease-2
VDLLNQRQLVAVLTGSRPPLTRTSEALHSALQAFEVAYARYDEHQRALEAYWVLRWLVQENVREIGGIVLRENLVRLDGVPLAVRVSGLPHLGADTQVRVAPGEIDLVECKAQWRWVPTAGAAPGGAAKELPQAQP